MYIVLRRVASLTKYVSSLNNTAPFSAFLTLLNRG